MKSPIFFTPGPSQIYPCVKDWINQAFEDDLVSLSHRSQAYYDIQRFASEQIRQLLSVPESYSVFYVSSATDAMERIIQSCVQTESYHLVNGVFSRRFAQTVNQLGKNSTITSRPYGESFDLSDIQPPTKSELIGVVHNETSTGVALPVAIIHQLKDKFPDKLIAVDIVSSAPLSGVDLSRVDLAFFSVQKGFGLPAGLAVLIASPAAIKKSHFLESQDVCTGSYRSFGSLQSLAEKHQTPETPNVLGIYLLGKVAADMNQIGIDIMNQEADRKLAMILEAVEQHPRLSHFVKDDAIRSRTTLVLRVEGGSSDLIEQLADQGIAVGSGYGSELKDQQVRIANFPAHSVQDVEKLVEAIKATY